MIKKSYRYCLIVTITITCASHCVFGQSRKNDWRLNNRLQIGWEADSNVEESLKEAESARGLRLHFNSQANRRWSRTSVQLSYHGGYQLYWSHASENKLINEVEAQAAFQCSRRIKIGIESWGRLKMFLNREPRYAMGDISPFLNIRLPMHLSLQITVKSEGLDYAASDNYDYSGKGVGIRLDKQIATKLSASPKLEWFRFRFDRPAFEVSKWGNQTPVDTQQEDLLSRYGCQIDWMWQGLLLNITYFYEIYNSNSYGYNFRRHRLNAIAAKRLFGVLLRLYANVQKKSYSDDLLPFWPLELDTEKEESNFLVVDISRELFAEVVLLFRIAWYENESPWPNLYYSKRLANICFEFRF